jgi:glycosyltransferase involved in cell wall biosynthesis
MLIGIDASRAAVARRTGTENYSLQLIRVLLRLGAPHRYRLYVNGPPPAGLFWTAGHVPECVETRSIPMRRLWTHLRLSGEMLARPPDVLFVPAHVLPLAHPRRSVVTVHDLGYLRYPEAHRANDRRYLHWSTRWNARQARAILADSAATKADLVLAYAAPAQRVHVVYLGRDESLVPEQNPDVIAAARAGYGIGERYVLYLGTLQPRKNLARLIEAFARVRAGSASGLQLVLAGRRGWQYDDLFRQVEKLDLAGQVLFPGYVADEDLAALYSGAMGFVFPSLYEGFGIPVLEAQGCGVPVMASNNSSLPEVAGDSALLVDPLDVDAIAAAMARLIAEPELRAELTRRGFENVKRFSWEKCARETLAVIESVANAKSHDA